jgi:hypothetical protein
MEILMTEKFNPAPIDKHAVGPKEAAKADKATHNELRKGLKDSFPASDPADLDAAVAAAYDWSADISEDDALARLFELNQARAKADKLI